MSKFLKYFLAFSFLACPIIAPTYAADDDEFSNDWTEDDEDDFVEEESKKSECDPSVFTKKCEDNGGTVGDYDDKTKICSITLSGSVKFENIKTQVKKTAKTICDDIGKKVIHNTSHNKWDIVCHVDCATGWFSLNVPNVKCPDDHTFNSDSGKCEKDESEKEEVVEAEKKEEEKPKEEEKKEEVKEEPKPEETPAKEEEKKEEVEEEAKPEETPAKEEEKKEEVKEEPKPEETPAKEEEKKEEVAQDSGDTGSDANADAAGTVAPEKPATEKPAEEKKAPDGKVEVDEKQIKRGKSNDRLNTTDMTMKTCGDAKQFLVKNNKLKSDASCECGEDYLDCGNSMHMFNKIERPNDWTVTISTQQQENKEENTKAETDEKSDEYKKCKSALLLDITAIKNGNGKRLVIPDSDVNDIKKRLNEYKKKKNKAPDVAVQRDVLEKYCDDKSADADGTISSSENFENEKSVHDFDDKSPASFDEATELISGWGKKNNVDFDKCEPSRGRTYVNCTAKNNGTYYTFYFTKIGDPDTDRLEKEFRAYAQKILDAHNAMVDTIKSKSATSETTEKPAEEQKS